MVSPNSPVRRTKSATAAGLLQTGSSGASCEMVSSVAGAVITCIIQLVRTGDVNGESWLAGRNESEPLSPTRKTGREQPGEGALGPRGRDPADGQSPRAASSHSEIRWRGKSVESDARRQHSRQLAVASSRRAWPRTGSAPPGRVPSSHHPRRRTPRRSVRPAGGVRTRPRTCTF